MNTKVQIVHCNKYRDAHQTQKSTYCWIVWQLQDQSVLKRDCIKIAREGMYLNLNIGEVSWCNPGFDWSPSPLPPVGILPPSTRPPWLKIASMAMLKPHRWLREGAREDFIRGGGFVRSVRLSREGQEATTSLDHTAWFDGRRLGWSYRWGRTNPRTMLAALIVE
jgi:hypothetical protein